MTGLPARQSSWTTCPKFPTLTRALLEKGYTPAEIKKLYGGNILRVLRQVEKVSAQLGKPAH